LEPGSQLSPGNGVIQFLDDGRRHLPADYAACKELLVRSIRAAEFAKSRVGAESCAKGNQIEIQYPVREDAAEALPSLTVVADEFLQHGFGLDE
jgi:hypothetical protein